MPTTIAPPPLVGRRMTLAEYHREVASGGIAPMDRVELLNGRLLARTPVNPPHASAVTRLTRLLLACLDPATAFRVQLPLSLPNRASEPFPDVCVARGPDSRYDNRHPTASDTLLVVEVADSSIAFDTGEKLEAYVAAGVPEYWVVDVADRRVDVHTNPGPTGYADRKSFGRGESVPVPGTTAVVPVDSILA